MNSEKQTSRDIQAEERRVQLLETALSVFSNNGFDGTSMRDLAKKAKISQGLIYHYFANKEQLLEETIEYNSFLPLLRQILTDKRERPLNEVFEELARSFLNLLDKKSDLVNIFIQEAKSNSRVREMWDNLRRECVSLMQEYLEFHVQRGELRPHNTEVTARSLFAIIFIYYFTRDVFQTSNLTREDFIKEALNNFLKGIEKN